VVRIYFEEENEFEMGLPAFHGKSQLCPSWKKLSIGVSVTATAVYEIVVKP